MAYRGRKSWRRRRSNENTKKPDRTEKRDGKKKTAKTLWKNHSRRIKLFRQKKNEVQAKESEEEVQTKEGDRCNRKRR